jgi:adenosylhomocysteine nucleosidase
MMIMILVLTPLSFECKALISALGLPARESDCSGVRVHHFEGFVVAVGGHGKVQFALTAQHLARELNPRLLICAGAGGALSEDVEPLDVVAAENTIEHDFNLRFESRELPRFKGDPESLERLRRRSTWTDFRIHFGTVASGDEDIVDAARAGTVRELTGGLAVAWEGAGGARAASFCHIPYLELRVITDLADASAPVDFKKHVQAGMFNLAEVIRHLASRAD